MMNVNKTEEMLIAGRQELSDDMLDDVNGASLWKLIKKAAKDLGEGVKSLF